MPILRKNRLLRSVFVAVLVAAMAALGPIHAAPQAVRGDANGDGVISLADAVYLGQYLFARGPAPPDGVEGGDANCEGRINVLDVVYLVNYLFRGGPQPKCPIQ